MGKFDFEKSAYAGDKELKEFKTLLDRYNANSTVENEIALTPNVMKLLNASIGDSIEVNQGNKTEKYIITAADA